MKIYFFIFLFLAPLLCFRCSEKEPNPDPSYYYWYDNEKIPLQINHRRRVLLITDIESEKDIFRTIKNSCPGCMVDKFGPITNDPILEAQHTYFATIRLSRYHRFLENDNIYYVAPFYRYQGQDIGLTNIFDVKLKDEHDVILLDSLATMTNTRIVRKMNFLPLTYILSCSRESAGNALEMANYFYETMLFDYSEPNFAFYSFTD